MRFVVFGAGAIGGVVGARLSQAGRDVVLIARGPHKDAIAAEGLTLQTPTERVTLRIPVIRGPRKMRFSPDDVVLLATKSQDTSTALLALRDAAPTSTPVVCLQNGVENERLALRMFSDVYGAVVMAPTAEIVLEGRLVGVPTPVNALVQSLMRQMAREGHTPGWLSAAEVLARA